MTQDTFSVIFLEYRIKNMNFFSRSLFMVLLPIWRIISQPEVFFRENTSKKHWPFWVSKNTEVFSYEREQSFTFLHILLALFFLFGTWAIYLWTEILPPEGSTVTMNLILRKLQFESNQWDENENSVKCGSKFIKDLHHSYENTGKAFISEIMHRQSNWSVQIF